MSISAIYRLHHAQSRRANVSVLKDERGELFKKAIGAGKTVLDVGCRDGTLTAVFTSGNTVVGVDVDDEALARARARLGIETMMVDVTEEWRALAGRRFDAIVAGEILEHLYFPQLMMRRVAEHLKPEGVFVGSVPNAFSLRHRLRYLVGQKLYTPLNDPTHINHFHWRELDAMLRARFHEVTIIGLGRYRWLARRFPGWWAFDLAFIARRPR